MQATTDPQDDVPSSDTTPEDSDFEKLLRAYQSLRDAITQLGACGQALGELFKAERQLAWASLGVVACVTMMLVLAVAGAWLALQMGLFFVVHHIVDSATLSCGAIGLLNVVLIGLCAFFIRHYLWKATLPRTRALLRALIDQTVSAQHPHEA